MGNLNRVKKIFFVKAFSFIFLSLITIQSYSQVNHWETVVYNSDTWDYFIGTSNPGNSWYTTSFNSTAWPKGSGGFGYGDGDDNTITGLTPSVFTRIDFNIVDTSTIAKALLNMDYDDSFVAYLNGVEIARSNIGSLGVVPLYNALANGNHEAVMYSGGNPESYTIQKNVLSQLLVPGNNVLAIEVHNVNGTSSDLSCISFLSLGITNSTINYGNTPTWFVAPFDFYSSNLPIITIDTYDQPIVDDPKIPAEIGIIYNGQGLTNLVTDYPTEFLGPVMIEQRGETSQGFAKKSYLFETVDSLGQDKDVKFLNFEMEEDWVLYGPYSDKTFLRNILTMKIGREMGSYHSRTRAVEVVLNDEYRGVYVLMEKIKRDKKRLDISKMTIEDTSGVELTGGYIFRIDKGVYDGWNSAYDVPDNPGTKRYFQYVYPKETDIQIQQEDYIKSYVDSFEVALASPLFHHPSGNRYNDFIEFRSFFDFFIINEVANNIDGFRLSSYFHKEKDSKDGLLHAGPFWDFNLAYGNGDYCEGWQTNNWQYLGCGQSSTFWWERFLEDTMYTRGLRCRWDELRQTTLSTPYLMNFIDSMQVELDPAASRNYIEYPVLGAYLWPNPPPWYSTYGGEVDDMQVWLTNRLNWLDNNMPGISSNCDDFIPIEPDTTLALSKKLEPLVASLKVIPNPVTDRATIFVRSEGKEQYLELYNSLGMLLQKTAIFNGGTFELKRDGLPSGVYILKAYSEQEVVGISKVVFK